MSCAETKNKCQGSRKATYLGRVLGGNAHLGIPLSISSLDIIAATSFKMRY